MVDEHQLYTLINFSGVVFYVDDRKIATGFRLILAPGTKTVNCL
jgi:hypothetical protein